MDTVSLGLYSALQIICLCGGGTFEPDHVLRLNVTLSFLLRINRLCEVGHFEPYHALRLNVTAYFLCIRALFSYPILCDVFRIGVLGQETVLAHIAYGNIHTALFDFQGT